MSLDLFQKYLKEGFKALRCKGYHPKYNPGKDYKTAKQAIEKGFTNATYKGLTLYEIEAWEKAGGWIGWLLPRGIHGIDIEDPACIEFLNGLFRKLGITPPELRTNNGRQYFFKTSDNLPGSPAVYTKCGVQVTYRAGGNNYSILAPTNGREWIRPLNGTLPELPKELLPYDPTNGDDLLNVFSCLVGDAMRSGLLHGYNDIDTAVMVFLIYSGHSDEQIHKAFELIYLSEYDHRTTQRMFDRAKSRLEGGQSVRGAGSFLYKIKDFSLKEIERFAQQLQKGSAMLTADESLPSDADLIPESPFPFKIFPERLLSVIRRLSEGLHVEPQVVASFMLAILSGVIGNTVRISPKQGYEVAPFIWFILIAVSGYGKTPVPVALLSHIKKIQAKLYQQYQAKMREYESALRKPKGAPNIITPEKPKLGHVYVSDCTVESLSDVFEANGRGVISYQDEIAGLIRGLDQYKGKGNDRQHYLELFNCQSWNIDRKSGSKFIPNTGVAIIGGIQPRFLPNIFGADSFDDGLLPRLLLLNAGDRPSKFSRQAITDSDLSQWENLIARCYSIPVEYGEAGFIKSKVLILSSDALDLWESFYNEYGNKMPFLTERARVFISKLRAYYSLKFAGVLHFIKAFDSGGSGRSGGTLNNLIDAETIQHAIDLTKFFAGQAIKTLRLYQHTTTYTEYERRLIDTLHELKDEVKGGMLPLMRIREVFNMRLPQSMTSEKVSSLLKGLGLNTKISTGGYSHLVWETDKLKHIFTKTTSTTSTTSTITVDKKNSEGEEDDIISETDKPIFVDTEAF